MINFENFYTQIASSPLSHWLSLLKIQLNDWQNKKLHGNFYEWFKSVEHLPLLNPQKIDLISGITADSKNLSNSQRQGIKQLLYNLVPWRKGPYSLYGIDINSEWRSDWKWERLLPHITSLKNKIILDVGCGNGYYMWRMLAHDTHLIIGIDPTQLFLCQFESIRKLLNNNRKLHVLPLSIEHLPSLKAFDTVFSMGVLYHRRFPIKHILQLKNQLKSGGELILETIVINDHANKLLIPKERYAQMKNTYFIPTTILLKNWLEQIDFINIRIVNCTTTTCEEQRSTKWMTNKSLNTFLDPYDFTKTIEGYPAPVRAILIATKP
ncbi:tRNA 5-methoxyuridine(34)/uridine 5-oxyacetic acid(34) synthase CmoB [Candidatus Pantoea edessiphila]|uniref:tRNA U34 carboxymethyltransferase n=1 Tax=Candidatus Pantoea edessiphila TaxID=2044610 RepID=A0A2P5T0T7_9GAMM|nr:tRNA 5-methoxyuridine(34)/uridine 5-oxyacetic acid(34) synthase CmoB [Candidatus Pantoea edessiphila]PPI88195.1 tRNA 5-methoxyuridine(34)/uridine 5-oxyacetic acid(34) synthase CmoB [Candidatus Pantoea edessiphila]